MMSLRSAALVLLLPAALAAQSDPIKCGVPALLLGESFRAKTDTRTAATQVYDSPGGKFRLTYETDGPDAVPLADLNLNGVPDYVEKAAQFADSSYSYQVLELGLRDPVLPGLRYNIYFEDLPYYGYTQIQGATTYIVLHSTFAGFPPNNDPEGDVMGALKVTIAHEFKHAIQYATNRWLGDAGNVNWVEMDATMMEEIVHPDVDDYYHYIGSSTGIFRNPGRSTPLAYDHATWMLHYAEAYGIGFWVDVWNEIATTSARMVTAISRELGRRGEDAFAHTFARNHAWHFASGTRTTGGYGFLASDEYPTATATLRTLAADTTYAQATIPKLAARYYEYAVPAGMSGPLALEFFYEGTAISIGLMGITPAGEVLETTASGDAAGYLMVSTPWSIGDVAFIRMVVGNAAETGTLAYSVRTAAIEIPEFPLLEPNFPNPFNPSTFIPYSIPAIGPVRITLWDVLGRRVATLVDGVQSAGTYTLRYDADNLASGVYFVRLETAGVVRTRAITLVR